MKLYHSQTSPFVRKVVVAAQEKGLAERIEVIDVRPGAMPESLPRDNPLAKVPALVADDGQALYDSLVICFHLDALNPSPLLVPEDPAARVVTLRRHALADGILEAAILSVMETRRPEEARWQGALDHQRAKILRGFDTLEGEIESMGHEPDLATITAGCAIGYVPFRLTDIDPTEGRPRLAAWWEQFSQLPSMVATAPKDPA